MAGDGGGVSPEIHISQSQNGQERKSTFRNVIDRIKGGRNKLSGFLHKDSSKKTLDEPLAKISPLSAEQFKTLDPSFLEQKMKDEEIDEIATKKTSEDTEKLDEIREALKDISEEDTSPSEQKIDTFTRENLDELLNSEEYSPQELIKFFSQRFGEEYAAWAGVDEGYSVGKHTEMVLSQFEKYFANSLPEGVNRNLFRTILALHDIGKHEAIKHGGTHFQHAYTVPLMNQALADLDFSEEERDIAKAIVNGDFIGESIKQQHNIPSQAKQIIEAAKNTELPIQDFFNTLKMYYMSDASSYTTDAGAHGNLNYLFKFDPDTNQVNFSPRAQYNVDVLQAHITGLTASASESQTQSLEEIKTSEGSIETLAKEGDIYFLHGIRLQSAAEQEKLTLQKNKDIYWEDKFKRIVTDKPELSVSTMKKGKHFSDTWSPIGVVLRRGNTEFASAWDAQSHFDSTGKRHSIHNPKDVSEYHTQLRIAQIGSGPPRNELGISNPEIAGIYVNLDHGDMIDNGRRMRTKEPIHWPNHQEGVPMYGIGIKDVFEFADKYGIKVFFLQNGTAYEGALGKNEQGLTQPVKGREVSPKEMIHKNFPDIPPGELPLAT
jgi:hypothetical protein